jgi:hypothetical protein
LILLSSLVSGCASVYKNLQPADENTECVRVLTPTYQKNWFTASIDVRGHHLSGLLLLMKMPDGSDRVVFTNELGVSFFDFEFSEAGFKVIQIIDKLNINAVINTLKQDFELLLLERWQKELLKKYSTANEFYYAYPWDEKINYIISDSACKLTRLERGSGKKKLVEISFEGDYSNPDKIQIKHFNFNMEIILTKIDR